MATALNINEKKKLEVNLAPGTAGSYIENGTIDSFILA